MKCILQHSSIYLVHSRFRFWLSLSLFLPTSFEKKKKEFLRLHCSAFHVHKRTQRSRNHPKDILKLDQEPRERRLFVCGFPTPSWRSFSFLMWNSRNARQILFRKEIIHAKRNPCADGTSGTDGSSDALQIHISCILTCVLTCAYTYLAVSLKRNNEREWMFPAASDGVIFAYAKIVQIFALWNHCALLIPFFWSTSGKNDAHIYDDLTFAYVLLLRRNPIFFYMNTIFWY